MSAPLGTSWIWCFTDYANVLNNKIIPNKTSFTHVCPQFYSINYNYNNPETSPPLRLKSGATYTGHTINNDGRDNFGGLTSHQVVDLLHANRLKVIPMIMAGSGNHGVDVGMANIILDSPAGTRQNFTNALIDEARRIDLEGFNLDFEGKRVGYSAAQFTAAMQDIATRLHGQGLLWTICLAQWMYVQSWDSGGPSSNYAVYDLAGLNLTDVDYFMPMAYTNICTAPKPTQLVAPAATTNDFIGHLNYMHTWFPPSQRNNKNRVVMGMISYYTESGGAEQPNNNPIADSCFSAIGYYGYRGAALWPTGDFLNPTHLQNGGNWYGKLFNFLASTRGRKV